jgi:hypothetical protein
MSERLGNKKREMRLIGVPPAPYGCALAAARWLRFGRPASEVLSSLARAVSVAWSHRRFQFDVSRCWSCYQPFCCQLLGFLSPERAGPGLLPTACAENPGWEPGPWGSGWVAPSSSPGTSLCCLVSCQNIHAASRSAPWAGRQVGSWPPAPGRPPHNGTAFFANANGSNHTRAQHIFRSCIPTASTAH